MRVQTLRATFRETVQALDVHRLKFVDESGVTLAMIRRYGRATPGQRVVDHVPANYGTNQTMIAALGLAGPLPKDHALRHGGCHGAGKFRLGIHHGGRTRFEVSQMAQRADDPPAARLDHGGDGGVGRGLALEKAWLAPLVGTIQRDPL